MSMSVLIKYTWKFIGKVGYCLTTLWFMYSYIYEVKLVNSRQNLRCLVRIDRSVYEI